MMFHGTGKAHQHVGRLCDRRPNEATAAIRRITLAGLSLGLLAACTSSHTTGNSEPQATAPASRPAAVSSPTTSPPTTQNTITGTATDSDGDRVNVTIYLGSARVATQTSDDAVQQCGSDLQAIGSSLDRALAIPFNVLLRIKSALSTPIDLNLNNGLHQVTAGGNTGPPDQMPYWAMDYSSGHVCQAPGDSIDASGISWATASPHGDDAGSGWLILPNAITPNDPTGNQSYATKIVIIPTIRLGNTLATFTFNQTSPGVVTCWLPDPAAGTTLFLATNPNTAIASGCTEK